METAKNWIIQYGWIIGIGITIFLTLSISYIEKIIYKKLHPKLKKSKRLWDDSIVYALHIPLQILIWIIGISIAVKIFDHTEYFHEISYVLRPIREVVLILLLLWFFARFIGEFEKQLILHSGERIRLDTTTIRGITQLTRLVIVLIGILAFLQYYGIPISGIIAFGGFGSLVLGLAAKDTLANFFGGFMLFWDRPFVIGDWIRSPDKNIEGTVENIGWRLTRIRTFDKRPLFVPNSVFSLISVENPSRMMNRRIKQVVGIRYKDGSRLEEISNDIETMLRNHEEIDTTKTLFVKFINFGPSSLEILIYTFTKTTDWVRFQSIQQDILLKILQIIESDGAQCAFPTTTVDLPKDIKL